MRVFSEPHISIWGGSIVNTVLALEPYVVSITVLGSSYRVPQFVQLSFVTLTGKVNLDTNVLPIWSYSKHYHNNHISLLILKDVLAESLCDSAPLTLRHCLSDRVWAGRSWRAPASCQSGAGGGQSAPAGESAPAASPPALPRDWSATDTQTAADSEGWKQTRS